MCRKRLVLKYNRLALLYRCKSSPRPTYPQNGLGKEFKKTYSIIKNIARSKNKQQKTDFSDLGFCQIFLKKSASELRKNNFSRSSGNFKAIRDRYALSNEYIVLGAVPSRFNPGSHMSRSLFFFSKIHVKKIDFFFGKIVKFFQKCPKCRQWRAQGAVSPTFRGRKIKNKRFFEFWTVFSTVWTAPWN